MYPLLSNKTTIMWKNNTADFTKTVLGRSLVKHHNTNSQKTLIKGGNLSRLEISNSIIDISPDISFD